MCDVGKVKKKRELGGARGKDAPIKIRGPCQSARMQPALRPAATPQSPVNPAKREGKTGTTTGQSGGGRASNPQYQVSTNKVVGC